MGEMKPTNKPAVKQRPHIYGNKMQANQQGIQGEQFTKKTENLQTHIIQSIK